MPAIGVYTPLVVWADVGTQAALQVLFTSATVFPTTMLSGFDCRVFRNRSRDEAAASLSA
jgi:hypothetical protein